MSELGTWNPGQRPKWVSAVNRGEVPLIAEAARRPLDRESLMAGARAGLGFDGAVGEGGWGRELPVAEPLDVLLPCSRGGGAAHSGRSGGWRGQFLVRLLQVRLQIDSYVRADPGVVDEEVALPCSSPDQGAAAPRSSSASWAAIPQFATPEGWELLRPVPPPRPERYPDSGRVMLADAELRQMATVVSGLDAIHHYHGRMPKECVSTMSLAFLSEEFRRGTGFPPTPPTSTTCPRCDPHTSCTVWCCRSSNDASRGSGGS